MTIALRPRGPFSLRPPLVVALTDDGGDAVALRAVWTGESVDPAFLRGLELDAALTHLESLPGIGPFGAMLIPARGAGHPTSPHRRSAASAGGRRGVRVERGARRGEARVAVGGVAPLSRVDHLPAAERGHVLIPRVIAGANR